ncbi:MAG TPA: glycosyltransferase family 2 protein [archaeon]|nr:glycosyltransferase family 2 protein [archaeon]
MSGKKNPYDLSLIICCYNEAEILDLNFRRVVSYLDNLKLNYELIVVDDCSRDGTRKIIRRLEQEFSDRSIKVIFHEENKGRGGAVKTGMQAAEGTVAGYIDIDLEVSEWYILPCVLMILNDGYDIVTGFRTYKVHLTFTSLSRHILSHVYRWLVRLLLKTDLKDTETGYKFFHREKILPVLDLTLSNHWFWDTEIMLLSERNGIKIKEIPCLFIRNPKKTSTVRVFKDSLDYLFEVIRFRARLKTIKS